MTTEREAAFLRKAPPVPTRKAICALGREERDEERHGRAASFFAMKKEKHLCFSMWIPAATYSPGPLPAKYHRH